MTPNIGPKTQVIGIDNQIDFITGSLPNPAFAEKLGYCAEILKKAILPPVLTADTHDKNYMETLEGKKLPVYHCIKGTAGWEQHPIIMNACNKTPIIVEKTTFGYDKWKEIFGLAEDIDEFYIFGTVNPICPTANAIGMRMAYPNKRIIVDFAGCGFMGNTPEEIEFCKKATKYVLNMQQIDVIND